MRKRRCDRILGGLPRGDPRDPRRAGFCRNADIAERLGVTRPSVTKALAGLSSRSLVEVAGRDVRLTPEGRRLAGATLEKHEFFRRLLCDAGVDGRTASEEAC